MADLDTLAVGRRYVDCIQAGRLDHGIVAADFVFNGPNGPPMDAAAADGLLQYFAASFPDHRTTIDAEVVSGNMVVFRWTTTATHEGEFLGIPPTHTQVTNKGITMLAVSDGKITEIWEMADFLGFMQQLGAIPATAAAG